MAEDQRDSDALPFTQVDRSAKSKALFLAGILDIHPAQALGGLIQFWDLCGDPRELERLLADGKEEVLLPGEEVRIRFHLASGKECEPGILVRLGLLEQRGDLFRVRGMSRFFGPVRDRKKTRQAASIAGKASVEARRRRTGTARPPLNGSRTSAERLPNDSPNVRRTSAEDRDAETQRSETQISRTTASPSQPDLVLEPQKPPDSRRRLTDTLCGLFKEATGQPYRFSTADGVQLSKLLKEVEPEEVVRRWKIGLKGKGWKQTATLAQLAAKWNDLAVEEGSILDDHSGDEDLKEAMRRAGS